MSMSLTRRTKLQQALQAKNLDGALFATGAHFMYLLDLPDFWFQRYSVTFSPLTPIATPTLTRPDCILYIPAEGEGVVIANGQRMKDLKDCDLPVIRSYTEHMDRFLLPELKGNRFAVGLSCFDFLKDAVYHVNAKAEIVPGDELVDALRVIKDETEIARMEAVGRLTDEAMARIVEILRPGITPNEIERYISQCGFDLGAEDMSFGSSAIVTQLGDPTAFAGALAFPKNRIIENNASVAFDMGYVLNGYCSDYGRTFYLGTPTDHTRESYKALQAAQCYLVDHIVPNVTRVDEISQILFDGLEQFGRGHQLTHHTTDGVQGHQIGIECHEAPWLNYHSEGILRPGMTFCSEPKIYNQGDCFMRVEDVILVTETGARFLTNFDRDLFVL